MKVLIKAWEIVNQKSRTQSPQSKLFIEDRSELFTISKK